MPEPPTSPSRVDRWLSIAAGVGGRHDPHPPPSAPGETAQAFWVGAQTRLEPVICYCSIYDECWQAASRSDEPVAVDTCRQNPKTAFAE